MLCIVMQVITAHGVWREPEAWNRCHQGKYVISFLQQMHRHSNKALSIVNYISDVTNNSNRNSNSNSNNNNIV